MTAVSVSSIAILKERGFVDYINPKSAIQKISKKTVNALIPKFGAVSKSNAIPVSNPKPISKSVDTNGRGEVAPLKPLGRGSTAKKQPENLKEQLALEEAMSNPKAGKQLKIDMTDKR